jgi:hypothetical protein
MTQQKNEIAANERKGSKSAQFSKRRTSSGLGSCAVLSADFHLRGSNYMPEHSFGCDAGHKGS